MYDYLIVGSGFFGSICAYELNKQGYKCLVLEKRNHIGGNCYTEKRDNINLHIYGPHIFHTSNEEIWKWINKFVEFNNFVFSPIACYKDNIYSLPFNMWTFNQLWGVKTPQEAKDIIDSQKFIGVPSNLEEQALSMVGKDVYETLIKGYTEKQWNKKAVELPASIIKRIPVRFTWDTNYFNDTYQGIPIGGYTQIFEKMLDGIEVKLNTNYFDNKEYFDGLANKIIYTGPIDRFFNYEYGKLEYRSLRWDTKILDIDNFQGNAIVNYTDLETEYTRITEHKWFDYQSQKGTVISYEYPQKYDGNNEPYYPIRDNSNVKIYEKYQALSKEMSKFHFGGRLATYTYFDMHQVIAQALKTVKELI